MKKGGWGKACLYFFYTPSILEGEFKRICNPLVFEYIDSQFFVFV